MNNLYQQLTSSPFLIAGPCVIETPAILHQIATELKRLQAEFQIPIIFKASFDKANRTSIHSFRGPGLEKGIAILKEIKDTYQLPITTDIHEVHQAEKVAEVIDIIQIPAFLSRQTDLILAAAQTQKIVNIKKAQFLSGLDMQHPLKKAISTGNRQLLLTERGNLYGYNNLVVDFRNIPDMKSFGYPVVMDCTHAVQRPGAAGGKTGGNREFVPSMALASKAFGADGYFMEVHPNPEEGLSDGPNMLYLKDLEELIIKLIE